MYCDSFLSAFTYKYISINPPPWCIWCKSLYTNFRYTDIARYISFYSDLARWKLTFIPHSRDVRVCWAVHTYVQACVNSRFDEHDLVASRGPFNGISVLRKREILNFKTRIRVTLSYSESIDKRRRRFLAYFCKCDKSAIRQRETEHKLRR